MRDRAVLVSVLVWLGAVLMLRGSTGIVASGFDFDEVLMVCTGLAAIAWVITDYKRDRDLQRSMQELGERVGAVESATGSHHPHSLAERVASIESALETFDPVEMRERMATFEARIDHKPVTQTRRSDGKFASPRALQDEIDRLTAELAAARKGGT